MDNDLNGTNRLPNQESRPSFASGKWGGGNPGPGLREGSPVTDGTAHAAQPTNHSARALPRPIASVTGERGTNTPRAWALKLLASLAP